MSTPALEDGEAIAVLVEMATVGMASCEGCGFHEDALDMSMIAGMQSDSMMHAISTGHVVNEHIARSLAIKPA